MNHVKEEPLNSGYGRKWKPELKDFVNEEHMNDEQSRTHHFDPVKDYPWQQEATALLQQMACFKISLQ